MQLIAVSVFFFFACLFLVRFFRIQTVVVFAVFLYIGLCFPGFASVMGTEKTSGDESKISVTRNNMRPCELTERESPWGTFLPGTWVIRKTNHYQFRQGTVLSSNASEVHLVLDEINEKGIILQQKSIIEIGDRVYTSEAKRVPLDFFQQPVSEDVVIEQLPTQTVIVARRQIVCQVCRYIHIQNDEKKTTTIWYSDTVMPYLLRLEEFRTRIPSENGNKETVLNHLLMTVMETSGTRLFKNMLGDYKTQTIKKTSVGTTVSHASYSTNIPGGLFREVSVERDANGKILGQSVTSVVDYFMASPGKPIRQRQTSIDGSLEIQTSWDNFIQEIKGDDTK